MMKQSTQTNSAATASQREKFAWCMFDFANSGYTTVVLTAVFNAYFVAVIAIDGYPNGQATFLWTLAMATANGFVLIASPLLGAIADHSASKKRFLIFSSIGCITFTALLSLAGPGDITLALTLVVLATICFAIGESLIAAFLPELAPPEQMGRLSGYGWTVGYLGGLLTLGLCLGYINWAEAQGQNAAEFVPATNLIVAVMFLFAALPTFFWLKERAIARDTLTITGYFKIGLCRLKYTLQHARQHQDLFRFLITLTIYHAGVNSVIVLAAIYAQEVMAFSSRETILLIVIVNITAAAGAFIFGHIQDRIGSKNALLITLIIWIGAIVLIYRTTETHYFWLAANLVGIALGASQSAGRALVGQFTPAERSGEFFGLWGLAIRIAAIIGPLSYGATITLMDGNHRIAILSTLSFFIVGLIMLCFVNEQRGRRTALGDTL